jgi:hypothetical protein
MKTAIRWISIMTLGIIFWACVDAERGQTHEAFYIWDTYTALGIIAWFAACYAGRLIMSDER